MQRTAAGIRPAQELSHYGRNCLAGFYSPVRNGDVSPENFDAILKKHFLVLNTIDICFWSGGGQRDINRWMEDVSRYLYQSPGNKSK